MSSRPAARRGRVGLAAMLLLGACAMAGCAGGRPYVGGDAGQHVQNR